MAGAEFDASLDKGYRSSDLAMVFRIGGIDFDKFADFRAAQPEKWEELSNEAFKLAGFPLAPVAVQRLVAAAGRAGKFVFIRGRFFAPKRIESCQDRSPDIALLQDPAHVAFDDIPCAVRFQGYCAFVQGQVWLSAALPESGRYFR